MVAAEDHALAIQLAHDARGDEQPIVAAVRAARLVDAEGGGDGQYQAMAEVAGVRRVQCGDREVEGRSGVDRAP